MTFAHIAGIRGLVFHAEVGPRNPNAVISPVINPHVITAGHMAFDTVIAITGLAFMNLLVEVMVLCIIGI